MRKEIRDKGKEPFAFKKGRENKKISVPLQAKEVSLLSVPSLEKITRKEQGKEEDLYNPYLLPINEDL